jgi:hypothetical protein
MKIRIWWKEIRGKDRGMCCGSFYIHESSYILWGRNNDEFQSMRKWS